MSRKQVGDRTETPQQAIKRIHAALQRITRVRNEQVKKGGPTKGFGIMGTQQRDIRNRRGSTRVRIAGSNQIPLSTGERIGGVTERRLQNIADRLGRQIRSERNKKTTKKKISR